MVEYIKKNIYIFFFHLYSSFHLQGVEYKVGDSAFLMPDSFSFNIKPKPPPKQSASKKETVSI